jgi:hypothetical protein
MITPNRIRERGGSDVEQEVKYAMSRGRDHARAPMQVSRAQRAIYLPPILTEDHTAGFPSGRVKLPLVSEHTRAMPDRGCCRHLITRSATLPIR